MESGRNTHTFSNGLGNGSNGGDGFTGRPAGDTGRPVPHGPKRKSRLKWIILSICGVVVIALLTFIFAVELPSHVDDYFSSRGFYQAQCHMLMDQATSLDSLTRRWEIMTESLNEINNYGPYLSDQQKEELDRWGKFPQLLVDLQNELDGVEDANREAVIVEEAVAAFFEDNHIGENVEGGLYN